MHTAPVRVRPGFTLIELLVVIAVIALLMGILLPTLSDARKTARRVVCMNNMSQFGKTVGTYGADYNDRIYAFTWRKGASSKYYSDLNNAADDVTAAANQAVEIIRRRGDQTQTDFPKIAAWIPHIYYTHLVLQDYLSARLPDVGVVCPEDRYRLTWQKHAKNWPGGAFPFPSTSKRWPYSSSYMSVAASFDRTSDPAKRLYQTSHNTYYNGNVATLGNQKIADVAFPSSKVLSYDEVKRHYGKASSYWAYDDVNTPIVFFDSSVRMMQVGKSNPGWLPTEPASASPSMITYNPAMQNAANAWEPPARSTGGDLYPGRFAWTRGGIRGVDFGGGEVNTGQPPPRP